MNLFVFVRGLVLLLYVSKYVVTCSLFHTGNGKWAIQIGLFSVNFQIITSSKMYIGIKFRPLLYYVVNIHTKPCCPPLEIGLRCRKIRQKRIWGKCRSYARRFDAGFLDTKDRSQRGTQWSFSWLYLQRWLKNSASKWYGKDWFFSPEGLLGFSGRPFVHCRLYRN